MSTTADLQPLRLLEGVELLGRVQGSGLREPPRYVRRPDGQVVQLSELLFAVARHACAGATLADIARGAGDELDVRLRPDQAQYLLEHKLFPLGIVTGPDGSAPRLERAEDPLALKFRVGVVPPRLVDAIGGALRWLFAPHVVVLVLGALLACDVWLLGDHGIDGAVKDVIAAPSIALLLVGLTYASLAFHELGHAAACRHGGARPGAIGIGIYLVWPVFYTDVTDSYRLGRGGRLRTDLGGMYFNAIFAIAISLAFVATGFEPLLLALVGQHLLVLDQFMPWVRLDGYYLVADLIGVSDLFSRIKPVLRSLLPGRAADPRVKELKRWARVAVMTWVFTAVAALTALVVVIVTHVDRYIERGWISLTRQAELVADAAAGGHGGDLLAGCVNVVFLLLPLVGLTLTYVLICRQLGVSLAVVRARASMAACRREL